MIDGWVFYFICRYRETIQCKIFAKLPTPENMKYRLFLLLLFNVSYLFAQGPSSYSLFVDQDFLQVTSNKSDENYTMGFGLKASNDILTSSDLAKLMVFCKDRVGVFLRPKDKYFPVNYDTVMTSSSGYLALSGNGFTPTDLNTPAIQYNDRPYSSLLLLSYGIGRLYVPLNKIPRYYLTEFSVGILGTGVSAQVQTWIHQQMNNHDTTHPYTPKGWGNQISNGGELTLLILNRSKYLVYSLGFNLKNKTKETSAEHPFRLLELTLGKESFFGYYTGAALSAGGRFGILDFRNWVSTVFPLQNVAQVAAASPAQIRKNVEIDQIYKKSRKFELYISSEFKPTLMLYNALLQGQFRNSAYTISGNKTNPFMYTWNNGIGANLSFFKRVNINAVYNFYAYKSPEFRRQNYHGRGHAWGGGYLTVVYYPK